MNRDKFEPIKLYGPHTRLGPGNVSHTITDGIQRDVNYSLRVQLDSLAGSSASNLYYFGKCNH